MERRTPEQDQKGIQGIQKMLETCPELVKPILERRLAKLKGTPLGSEQFVASLPVKQQLAPQKDISDILDLPTNCPKTEVTSSPR